MYSRISWEATSGLPLEGAQHGRGRFILPNRASSANITRKGRPLAVATRRAFLTSSRNPFFYRLLAPLYCGPDEKGAASICAIHGGPRDRKPCCCLSRARSPLHTRILTRRCLAARRRPQLSQIWRETPFPLPTSYFPAAVHQSASALTR